MVKRKQRHRITAQEARDAIIDNMEGFLEQSEARNVIEHVRADNLNLYALCDYLYVLFDLGVSLKMDPEQIEPADSKKIKLRNVPKVIVHGDQISPVTFFDWGGYALGAGWSTVQNIDGARPMDLLQEGGIRAAIHAGKVKMARRLADEYRRAGGGEPKTE